MADILIVDDDQMLCDALSNVIQKEGHVVTVTHNLGEGLKQAEAVPFEVIILDVCLPDGNGLDLLPQMRNTPGDPEVIILTGAGDAESAELAMRSGVWDYMLKPPTLNKIRLAVQRAVEHHRAKRNRRPFLSLKHSGIIGTSRALLDCLNIVSQAAATDSNVLIRGETGSGKELFARAVHDNSRRKDGPFVVVDCAALPEKLVESTLFGHEKGAFTGADRKFEGLIRQADLGTIFLDEIGELPVHVQKGFLRVLQERRFRPVGGDREVISNFRLVAATNRDLETMIRELSFREDLYFRIRTMQITLPPLRQMKEDIETLLNYYLSANCRKKPCRYSSDFLKCLVEYDWPGNVRELISAVEHAVATAGEIDILQPRHLPMEVRVHQIKTSLEQEDVRKVQRRAWKFDDREFPNLKHFRAEAVAELERQYLQQLMTMTRGDVKRACDVSGLSRARLYALLNARGVTR